MFRIFFSSLLLAAAAHAASADAMTSADMKRCKAMAATMAPKKAEIETLEAKRDELAAVTETKGEAWEDAEVMRLASSGHAQAADERKQSYTEAKKKFLATEQALQSMTRQFNQDVISYNQSCSTGN